MRRGVSILAFLVVVMIAGGLLTAGLGIELPFIEQTSNPMGSVFEAPGEQALYLFLMIAFVLINVVGAGLTIAFIFWLLNREVKNANAMPNLDEALAANNANALPEKAK